MRCGGFVVKGIGDRHHACIAVDGEQATGIIGKRIAHAIRYIVIGCLRGNANGRTNRRVFSHGRSRWIGIGNGTHIEFIDIGNGDRVTLAGCRRIGGSRYHRDRMGSGRLSVERTGHGDHTGIGVDGEESARIIAQAVSHRRRTIGIDSLGGDAHGGTNCRIFCNGISGGVGIGNRTDRCFVHIGDIDRNGFRYRVRAVRCLDSQRVAVRGLVVDRRGIGHGNIAAVVDRERRSGIAAGNGKGFWCIAARHH